MYAIPEMPLVVGVWVDSEVLAPTVPPTYLTVASISPIRIEDFFRVELPVQARIDTIIRLPKDALLKDISGILGGPFEAPYCIIEGQDAPGTFYQVIITHRVGRGFPNEFRRAYCIRVNATWDGGSPP